ncbi:MAG: hypothetical protein E6I19_12540 [Chloroflexi bacterium]|nr:MAG: hypothetical protein E6I19_12540 [Chloroflexota bacterium]
MTGQPVNIGARLQSAARPGEVLVGSLTRELTATSVRYAAPRWIEAKGAGAVEAFVVLEMLEEPAAFSTVPSAALVDRDSELRLLFDTYERVENERSTYLVTLYGEAGVGKSRIAREFIDRVGPHRVRAGRCAPYGEGVTLAPLQEILRADLGIVAADDVGSAKAKLDEVVGASSYEGVEAEVVSRGIAILAGLATVPSMWPDLPAESVVSELNYALRRFLEHRSANAPLVLVLEDAHWAAPALLDAIEHLTEWARAPLLILCLARSELIMRRPSWGGGKMRALAMTLDPLSPDHTRELVEALLPATRSAHRDEIVRRSEGNPLYVEEFVRRLVESNQSPMSMPATLQGLIAARVDAVEPALKSMLQRASVAGRVFSTEALTALGEDVREVASRLRTGLRRDFIAATAEQGSGGRREYRFNHVLTRDVVYASVPKSERAKLHDRFSRWLEAVGSRRGVGDREIVAYHAEQACLFAREIGLEDAPALASRAFLMLLAAATSSRDRADYHGSRALFQRAAAIGEATDVDPALLIEARGYAATSRLRLEGSPEALAQLEGVLNGGTWNPSTSRERSAIPRLLPPPFANLRPRQQLGEISTRSGASCARPDHCSSQVRTERSWRGCFLAWPTTPRDVVTSTKPKPVYRKRYRSRKTLWDASSLRLRRPSTAARLGISTGRRRALSSRSPRRANLDRPSPWRSRPLR